MTPRDQVYGRAEYTQKNYDLLAFKGEPHEEIPGEPEIADVYEFTAGYMRDFELVRGLKTGLGADLTVYAFPSSLQPVYGKFPVSGHFFLRLRWGRPHGAGHAM